MSEPSPSTPDRVDERRQSRHYLALVTAAVSFVALLCVAYLVPVPYVTMRPGPAFNTLGEIDGTPMFTFADDVTTYETDGALDFTTVSVSSPDRSVRIFDAIAGFVDDDVMVVPRESVYPDGETTDQSRELGAAQLTSSKDTSRAAALRAAGYDVTESPQVAGVIDDGAASGLLEPDDLILAVDGEQVSASSDVVEAIGRVSPGEPVVLTVERAGQQQDVEVVTRPAPDDSDRPLIGITVGTSYDFPIEIENNVGDQVGGPSAGTMFALAIYDRLTPGSLTGGQRIAGTGSIDGDGQVGRIGGVRQKMAGAAADGATIFLVPADNCAEAADGSAFGMTLVEVSTLDGAIDALETLADDPRAEVPTCR